MEKKDEYEWFKRIVSGILAASITSSTVSVNAADGVDELKLEEVNSNPDDFEISSTAGNDYDYIFDVICSSHTESTISLSWNTSYITNYASCDVLCDGSVVASEIINDEFIVDGLEGGKEYSLSVRAYNTEGIIVAQSEILYVTTDWIVNSDVVLYEDKTVSNLKLASGTIDLNGHTLTIKDDLTQGAYGSSSCINVNGGKLYVEGDYTIINERWSYATINMTDENDYICVSGNFCISGV